MESTEVFRGCQPVTLRQVTSAGVRVPGAPTHPGRRLSGTQAPLRMNCRAAAAARHLAPPPVPHHTGRPGIRLMARPAFLLIVGGVLPFRWMERMAMRRGTLGR